MYLRLLYFYTNAYAKKFFFKVKNAKMLIKKFQVVEEIAEKLSYIQSHLYSVEISYFDFLNRVGMEEQSLRNRGLWEVPHPWLNLFVPRSGIKKFMDLLMENISPNEFEGPILVYPLLSDK